jgi:hypothetical protein
MYVLPVVWHPIQILITTGYLLSFGLWTNFRRIGNWELGMLKNQGPKVLMPDFNVFMTIAGKKFYKNNELQNCRISCYTKQ